MSRSKTFALFVPIVIAMVILDRLAKGWAVDHLRQGVTGPEFGLVDLTLVHNKGAAFGMGQGAGIVFVALAVVICVAVVVWLVVGKRHGALEVVSLALVVASRQAMSSTSFASPSLTFRSSTSLTYA